MTSSGVAYWIEKTNTEGVIKKWPSKHLATNPSPSTAAQLTGDKPADPTNKDSLHGLENQPPTIDAGNARPIEDKVPTVLEYLDDKQILWGYLCSDPAESSGRRKEELFKFYLSDRIREATFSKIPQSAPSLGHVQKWMADFVKKLEEHVKEELEPQLSDHDRNSTYVEYHFSVPTTWSPDITKRFIEAIGNSKIGGGNLESRSIDLAEAEAAAVQIAKDYSGKLKVS